MPQFPSASRVASRHAQWLWLGAALEGLEPRLAAQVPHFQAVFFMGLPGAGKGYVKGRRYLKHTGFRDIDPDEIKKTHPDYNPEDPSASRIHEWSSLEAARQFQDALKTGASFILDGTGTDPTKLIAKMAQAKEANFRVFLVNVHAPLEVSIYRNRNRGAEGGRWVDEKIILGKVDRQGKAFSRARRYADKVKVELNYSGAEQRIAQRDMEWYPPPQTVLPPRPGDSGYGSDVL